MNVELSRIHPVEHAVPPAARVFPLAQDVQLISDSREFEALEGEWNELFSARSSNSMFLTWDWMHTWWRHFSAGRRLHLITVRRGGCLTAIAPLCLSPMRLRHVLPLRILEFVGSGPVGSDHLDLLVRPGEEAAALPALATYLADRRYVLRLAYVDGGASNAMELARLLELRGWAVNTAVIDRSPYIDLSAHSWDAFVSQLGNSHRYNVLRRCRSLDKHFSVSFETVKDEQERRAALATLVHLHLNRRQDLGGSDALHEPELIRFHEDFSARALHRGWLRLHVLRLDGRAAACIYGFMHEGRYYYYQSGLDADFGRFSVGHCVVARTIECAIAEGAVEYDLLRGSEQYKYLWTNAERDLVRYEIFPPQLHGLAFRCTMQAGRSLKNAVTAGRRKPGDGGKSP